MAERVLEWTGYRQSSGYARFKVEGQYRLAHRVAWVLANRREIPAGQFICHSCDNRACVNPAHLWPGSNRQNMLDMYAKGRGIKTQIRGGRVIAAHLQPEYLNLLHREAA